MMEVRADTKYRELRLKEANCVYVCGSIKSDTQTLTIIMINK